MNWLDEIYDSARCLVCLKLRCSQFVNKVFLLNVYMFPALARSLVVFTLYTFLTEVVFVTFQRPSFIGQFAIYQVVVCGFLQVGGRMAALF